MKKIIVIILILFCNTIYSQEKEIEKKFVYPNRSSLQKIIDSHKGSVIYLDFWASWCKPCRKEIKKMKGIKEYFIDKSVSFIYISIEGEKIKCAEAIEKDGIIEENYLMYELFNDTGYKELDKINAIPHYIIFNKKGEMVNSNAPSPSQESKLIKELNKYLDEE
jgi:thiol-disulfide isomerase/thioredoxin